MTNINTGFPDYWQVSDAQPFPGRRGGWAIQYSVVGDGGVLNRGLTTYSRPATTVAVDGVSSSPLMSPSTTPLAN